MPATGVTAIFGPSGCGKTTVARCLAGLQYLPGSFCAIDGEIWQDPSTFRKAHQRPIGYVFQEASLFSHLSVRRNLLYGAPRDVNASGPDDIGFDEVIELLGLAKLLDRSPHNLSGGERQRVAIGRALLSQPKLLLMDEPLSALDRLTKNEILPFLERLHERLSLPVIYISHDMSEIERLADHLILMQHGKVVGAGPLQVLQSDPSLPLAGAREAAVSLDATVEAHDAAYGLLTLRVAGGRLLVPAPPVAAGKRQRLRIAASDVSIARAAPVQFDPQRLAGAHRFEITARPWRSHRRPCAGSRRRRRATLGADHASILGLLGLAEGMTCSPRSKAFRWCPERMHIRSADGIGVAPGKICRASAAPRSARGCRAGNRK